MSELVLPAPGIWTPDYGSIGERLKLPKWAKPWERTKEDYVQEAYGLVGSPGTVLVGGTNSAITPLYGQTPTAGNLLVLAVPGFRTSTITAPGTPSGWTAGPFKQDGTGTVFVSAAIFFKIAAGGDAAPIVPAGGSACSWDGQCYEFSGNAASSPNDQSASGSSHANGSTLTTITAAGIDAAAAELVFAVGAARYGSAATKTLAHSFNNGATATTVTNNATSTTNHYAISYGITTTNPGADADGFTYSSLSTAGAAGVLMSFLLAAAPTTSLVPRLQRVTGWQAF